ncbi:BldC family transcriptional regulator [Streptosporangium saharense]|uniref:Putative DNA-binding transcriptional regulator AlpA n=2 Tax=Streptosporangium saharense TaxID=1706840 RepID=A0A7W7VPF8_9ACTN|nr:putative DNA-binding transcriptional regulator AlpA [Streptosporangium saharense]
MPYRTKKKPPAKAVAPDGTFAMGETTDRLLTPGEVAHIFGVDPKTVNRWSLTGKIPSIRTPSGQRRYRQSDINQLISTDRG